MDKKGRQLRNWRGERGAALVEFALSAALLFALLFGVMAICLALYCNNVVSEAAREGARYAIVRGSTSCADSTPDCNASDTSIQAYVQGLGFPGINPQNMKVNTTWAAFPPGGPCSPSPACNNPGNQVQVTVQYTFPLRIPFVMSQDLALSSVSQMVISQ